MIIMSIDASTKSSGIAIFNNDKLIYSTCIQCNYGSTYKRINYMIEKIVEILKQYKPTNIVMEDALPDMTGYNQSTYRALMYLQGGLMLQFDKLNYQIDLVVSSHWRKLMGFKLGRYAKRDYFKQHSVELVKNIFGLEVNDDIADAINIGLAYWKENGSAF